MTNSFGIYVHVPFCVHKCSYCDFYSFTKYDERDFKTYTEVLCTEIKQAQKVLKDQDFVVAPAKSLFFGGGTPSLLPVPLLEQIINSLRDCFEFEDSSEITIEANPETVTPHFLENLRKRTQVNRISLGAQSFSERNLKTLDRLGSKESIYQAADLLKEFAFRDFNLDLIFAIPGQNRNQMLDDIAEVISLNPTHISSYNLTLKPGHLLYEKLPKDDLVAELYEEMVGRFENAGYEQYEISNFSKPDFNCKHNLLYWSGGDFLGIGPSASSRLFKEGLFHHRKEFSDFNKYLHQREFSEIPFERTTQKQTCLEATFLELRKNSGIELKTFFKRYAYDPSQSRQFLLFEKEGFICKEGTKLFLTPKGRLLADIVTERLVDD